MNYMQEAAWKNAGALGFSSYDLLKNGVTWVMNRISLEVQQLPGHLDEIIVDTWPSGQDKYFVYRDYKVSTVEGEVIARATSNWVVLDIKTRKLTSVPDYIKNARFDVDRGNLERVRGKVNFNPGLSDHSYPVHVSWLDMDLNGHVNNSNYFKWLMDALPEQHHENHSISQMDISFMAEGYNGEQLDVQSYINEGGKLHQRIYSNTNSRTLVSATSHFNKN